MYIGNHKIKNSNINNDKVSIQTFPKILNMSFQLFTAILFLLNNGYLADITGREK